MSETTVIPADDIRDDFEMVTSDQPGVIQRALAAEGAVEEGSTADGISAEGSDTSLGTGDDSDSSVGDQVTGETDPVEDEKIVEAEIEGEKLKISHGLNKRFGKLTAKISERDRINADLTRQLNEAKALLSKPADQKTTDDATKPKADEVRAAEVVVEKYVVAGEPKSTDLNADGTAKYPTYGDFIEGHAKWAKDSLEAANDHLTKQTAKLVKAAVEKLQADLETKSATDKANEEITKIRTAFESRQAKVAEVRKDFNDVVKLNKNNVQVSDPVKRIIFLHEKGAELQYHLAANPSVASALLALPVELQAAEAGAIIATLDTPKTPKSRTANEGGTGTGVKPKTPTLPAPLPRGGASGNRGAVTRISNARAATMDFDDYHTARSDGRIS